MHRSTFVARAAATMLLALCLAPAARAGDAADALGQCLIHATSAQDRGVLAQWVFATLALDPDVAPLAAVTPAQRDAINRRMGAVVTALLTVACRTAVQRAIVAGGPAAIEAAFEVWGRWAVTGVIAQPQVAAGMGALLDYVDIGKLMTLLPLLPPASGGSDP